MADHEIGCARCGTAIGTWRAPQGMDVPYPGDQEMHSFCKACSKAEIKCVDGCGTSLGWWNPPKDRPDMPYPGDAHFGHACDDCAAVRAEKSTQERKRLSQYIASGALPPELIDRVVDLIIRGR